jgi:hypothetical protein
MNQSALHTITLPFDAGTTLIVDGTRQAEIHIIVNLLEVFKTPVNLSFASLNYINSPGADAVMVANNYSDMFKFDHIHNAE